MHLLSSAEEADHVRVPKEPECIAQGTRVPVCVWVLARGLCELKTARKESLGTVALRQ